MARHRSQYAELDLRERAVQEERQQRVLAAFAGITRAEAAESATVQVLKAIGSQDPKDVRRVGDFFGFAKPEERAAVELVICRDPNTGAARGFLVEAGRTPKGAEGLFMESRVSLKALGDAAYIRRLRLLGEEADSYSPDQDMQRLGKETVQRERERRQWARAEAERLRAEFIANAQRPENARAELARMLDAVGGAGAFVEGDRDVKKLLDVLADEHERARTVLDIRRTTSIDGSEEALSYSVRRWTGEAPPAGTVRTVPLQKMLEAIPARAAAAWEFPDDLDARAFHSPNPIAGRPDGAAGVTTE